MRVEKDLMVALGYGKYFRSDVIVGLQPIEEEAGRGPAGARWCMCRATRSQWSGHAQRARYCVTW